MEVERLLAAYRVGERTPTEVVDAAFDRIEADETNAWIATRDREDVLAEAADLATEESTSKPLYGVPFAVKDNVDYAGLPTTAGCPADAYDPDEHAAVVRRLIDAGAILLGKTNMDQFATGLVGTRSPHGACRNVYAEEYISGGSSSGSAVAVARGHVAFALGTDTAGSGRVPAALNGLVGLKPTRGALSTRGVVPACADLDCVSVFARTTADALRVEAVAAGFDPADPYSRRRADDLAVSTGAAAVDATAADATGDVVIGVPAPDEREFVGDREAAALFDEAVETLSNRFGEVTTVEFSPFRETAELLYGGPWVADRLAAVGEFIEAHPEAVDPTVAAVIQGGEEYTAVDAFEAFDRLATLRREAEAVFADIDALVVPTVPTTYTRAEVASAPIETNSTLGTYTNFVNLLDLSAVAVPTGSFADGPTFGVTVVGEAFADASVAAIGERLRAACEVPAPPATEPVEAAD